MKRSTVLLPIPAGVGLYLYRTKETQAATAAPSPAVVGFAPVVTGEPLTGAFHILPDDLGTIMTIQRNA